MAGLALPPRPCPLRVAPNVVRRVRVGLPPASGRSSASSVPLVLCCCTAVVVLSGLFAPRSSTPVGFLGSWALQTALAGGPGPPTPSRTAPSLRGLGGCPGRWSSVATAAVDPSDCSAVRGEAINGILLPPMDSDEPSWISFVISRYLDEEWVEQPVHSEIGEAVGQLYRESRDKGDDDLIAVLAHISYGLKDMWSKAGFAEAFEGPVDVANRAAEFIMLRLGREVWSYGQSNSDVQEKMLKRLAEYEEARRALRDAVQAE